MECSSSEEIGKKNRMILIVEKIIFKDFINTHFNTEN